MISWVHRHAGYELHIAKWKRVENEKWKSVKMFANGSFKF